MFFLRDFFDLSLLDLDDIIMKLLLVESNRIIDRLLHNDGGGGWMDGFVVDPTLPICRIYEVVGGVFICISRCTLSEQKLRTLHCHCFDFDSKRRMKMKTSAGYC